jgi:hypothetical protein
VHPNRSNQKVDETKKRMRKLSAMLATTAVIGSFVVLVSLLTGVHVVASDVVKASDPFSSSITISNTGYIPLRSLYIRVCLGAIQWTSDPIPPSALKLDWDWDYLRHCIHATEWESDRLGRGDEKTIALKMFNVTNAAVSWADLAIEVNYELPFIPVKRRQLFPMATKRQSDGKLYWFPKSDK